VERTGETSPAEVRDHLAKLLNSSAFRNAERLSRFLAWTVERSLEGRVEELKEYALGVAVFDRKETFDSRLDPIVRVEAGRLRLRLRDYYEHEGKSDALRIDLPKGGYVPRFLRAESNPERTSPAEATESVRAAGGIAVLPFADHSSGRDQEYFCDGVTEEIINALTKMVALRVVAWPSSARLKGRTHDLVRIERELRVDYILEGSVRKSGSRVRITARLIRVSDRSYLWSETYDRTMEDVFSLQEEISRAIVSTLRLRLTGAPAVRPYTRNLDAYTLYLKGRHHWNERSEPGLWSGIECFRQATSLDPGYALAYSGLADSYSLLANYGAGPPHDLRREASQAALAAIGIDSTLAEARTSLAHVRATYDWNWKGAETEYQAAISLNPAYATARHWYGMTLLAPMGLLEEAAAQIQAALELDPLSLGINRDAAIISLYRRRYDEALSHCDRTLSIDTSFYGAWWALGMIFEQTGELDKAIDAFRRARERQPEYPRLIGALGHSYAVAGAREAAESCLRELSALGAKRYVSPFEAALIQTGLGDIDKAFEGLDVVCRSRSYELIFLRTDPRYEPLRGDPRYERLSEAVRSEWAVTRAK
jgi:serine/threonine-protein kinase